MTRPLNLLLAGVLVVAAAVSANDGLRGDPPQDHVSVPAGVASGLPAGVWKVQFANSVVEICEIRPDGTASVVEPRRSSTGRIAIHGQAFVIMFEDDRIERWTPVGKRLVVEHWPTSAQWPTSPAVLGIADAID